MQVNHISNLRSIARKMVFSTMLDFITCERCSGSGKYSYCEMYKDMCFSCKGKGKILACADQKAWKEFSDLFLAAEQANPDTTKAVKTMIALKKCSENTIKLFLDRLSTHTALA